jgi:hypothetical protein
MAPPLGARQSENLTLLPNYQSVDGAWRPFACRRNRRAAVTPLLILGVSVRTIYLFCANDRCWADG